MGGNDADVANMAPQICTQLRCWVRIAGALPMTWHHAADVATWCWHGTKYPWCHMGSVKSCGGLYATWHCPLDMGGAHPPATQAADVAPGHPMMPMCNVCHVALLYGCIWVLIYIYVFKCVRDTMWAPYSTLCALQCHADVAEWLMSLFHPPNMLVSHNSRCVKFL